MSVEDRLRAAMKGEVATVHESPDRWAEVEFRAAAERRARVRRHAFGWSVGSVAAVAAALLLFVPLAGSGHGKKVNVAPGTHTPTTLHHTVTSPVTPAPTTTPTTVPAPATGSHYLPLFPFADVAAANAANQPWQLDPAGVALHFAQFLGYSDITQTVSVSMNGPDAEVTVGIPYPSGGASPSIGPIPTAVVHLRRFGTRAWEAVGTNDSASFSVDTPTYDAKVTTPLRVGGKVNGVDLSIRVKVFQLPSTTPLGTACCLPAGNSGAPWSTTVSFKAPAGGVLIVAASAGGGLSSNGLWAVTGVRVGTTPAVTPGL